MGKIFFEKCTALKEQPGKPTEFTITMRGLDLSLEDQIEMLRLRGQIVEIPRKRGDVEGEIPSDVESLLSAITPFIENALQNARENALLARKDERQLDLVDPTLEHGQY